jgi:hypothetical protein
VAQTIEFGQQLSFGAVGEPYRTPYGVGLLDLIARPWYLANHPPQPSGPALADGLQGEPGWFMVSVESGMVVEFSTDAGSTWTTFLAAGEIGQFYSDGQNWRINTTGMTLAATAAKPAAPKPAAKRAGRTAAPIQSAIIITEGDSIVYPIDII